ncbi:MAG: T9SS type A sorting domain-containing protein, partial [candidate division Zixibacteria bacterium]|nr:T9SS type A sorting domain-containing protein [candidate division Zixibacteria bacterium]
MKNKNMFFLTGVVLFAILVFIPGGLSLGAEITHDTQSEFSLGTFYQTILEGSEPEPEIRLDSYTDFVWSFEDDDIAGWTFNGANGGSGEENPAGQIHLLAQWAGAESYGYSYRTDVAVPSQFSLEYLLYIDTMDSSGVVDPFTNQPTGACCRLDLTRSDGGIRVDIFKDRIVSFYREGTSGANYPTLANIDISTNTGQWYTIRFDVDFDDPNLAVQVYRDDGWIGELVADTRNSSGSTTIRQMAYSRGSLSGLSECHIDYVKLGTEGTYYYTSGDYTSEVLDINADSLGTLSWTEIPASPYPWSSWVKYAGNPIISGPCLNENILVDIDDPLQQPILYDGKYWMCYSSGGSPGYIRLAYSTDPGLMTWTDYESNPILSPTPGVENYVFSPNIFLDGVTYYLVYDVSMVVDGRQRNAYATAPAPTGPWTKGQTILELGAPGEWDDYRVTEPYVFKDGDTYFMYYMGDHICSGCNEQVGLATTTAALFPLGPEVGGLWTKHGLVLPHDPDPLGWDRGLTADPSIIKVGDTFYMRYTGSYANEHWQLGTAWATDPYGPWNRPAAPDITLGPPGSWDDDRLVRGAIHYHNGRYYSPYTGNGGSGYQGGIASADSVSSENLITFETRTSPDGNSWEDWYLVDTSGAIQSTPDKFFQYRATFNLSLDELSPTLTSVTFNYEEYQGPIVSIDMLPDSPPVVVPRGGSFGFIGTLTNNTNDPQSVDVGVFLKDVPWGGWYGPIVVYHNIPLDPYEVYADSNAAQSIPGNAIIGAYTYIAFSGEYPTTPYDSAWFDFTITSGFNSGSSEWEITGWFGDEENLIPQVTELIGNYPNPFNAMTNISFNLANSGEVELSVYNLMGQTVEILINDQLEAGRHQINWNASDYSSGIYFYKLT